MPRGQGLEYREEDLEEDLDDLTDTPTPVADSWRDPGKFRFLTSLEGYSFSNEVAAAADLAFQDVRFEGYGLGSRQNGWDLVDAACEMSESCRDDLMDRAAAGDQAGFVSRLEQAEEVAARFLESARGGLGFVSREGYRPPRSSARTSPRGTSAIPGRVAAGTLPP